MIDKPPCPDHGVASVKMIRGSRTYRLFECQFTSKNLKACGWREKVFGEFKPFQGRTKS